MQPHTRLDSVGVRNQQPSKKDERVRGIQSGELFVRLNGAELCEPQGTLHGARPFLQKLLHLQGDDTSAVQRLVQPSEAKLAFGRKLRRQVRQKKRAEKKRLDAVRGLMKVYGDDDERSSAMMNPVSPDAVDALERYLQHFRRLEQAYKQHVTSDILHLSALLEAESQYITAWSKREDAKCRDRRALTKLLYQFNSFALQLESETSGQVRMWRLPASDAQRVRCVKAATENIKKQFLSSPRSLEVLEVYKIENRVLLHSFQRFTTAVANATSDIKIKGLFCSVPAESVERCIVYGMHSAPSGEPRFTDSQGAEVKVFNRSVLLQGREDAPGTSMAFRARSKVRDGVSLTFPRRFSRYSTLEEMRASMTASKPSAEDESPPVQYLGLCRVAIAKTMRVKESPDVAFPDDPSIGALHFTNEEEYLVRYPDAVVPEFLVQFRVKVPAAPLPVDFSNKGIIPVPLTSSVPSLASSGFQDFIYSAAFDSPTSSISAFPLALPPSDRQRSFVAPNAPHGSSRPPSSESEQQDTEGTAQSNEEELQVSPETVLANCARQKTQLREDLQRIERLFWARAREMWEEEEIRSGVKLTRANQLLSPHEDVQARAQQLHGDRSMLNPRQQVQEPPARTRPPHLKHAASSGHRRR